MRIQSPHPQFDVVGTEMARYGEPQHEVTVESTDHLYGPPQHESNVEDPDWLIAIACQAFRTERQKPQRDVEPSTESASTRKTQREPLLATVRQ